jgi:CubicO group peptidase (beta-lactamase class C family)
MRAAARDRDFEAVASAMVDAVGAGREVGLQVAVVSGSEVLFEACAGVADTHTRRPVDASTLFPVFSATKGITATAVHVQAERGLLDYDSPIARYWPEFAAAGKAAATVRHALLHQVGIPQMPEACTVERMCDWDWMTREVAALMPLWPPGERSGYHAYTFGWILGEVVRRTDPQHRPFGRFVREEVAEPIGATDLWLGIPDSVEPRIARLEEGRAKLELPDDSPSKMAIPPHLFTDQATFGRPDVRRSCHPGAGGVCDATSLARMYALLAAGGSAGGRRLLAESRVAAAVEINLDEQDMVLGRRVTRGLGYWVAGGPNSASTAPMGDSPTSVGHPGAGGSVAWADRTRGVGVAILKNHMLAPAKSVDNPLTLIGDAIRAALDSAPHR